MGVVPSFSTSWIKLVSCSIKSDSDAREVNNADFRMRADKIRIRRRDDRRFGPREDDKNNRNRDDRRRNDSMVATTGTTTTIRTGVETTIKTEVGTTGAGTTTKIVAGTTIEASEKATARVAMSAGIDLGIAPEIQDRVARARRHHTPSHDQGHLYSNIDGAGTPSRQKYHANLWRCSFVWGCPRTKLGSERYRALRASFRQRWTEALRCT